MKAAMVTFVGGQGAAGVDPYVWGGIAFPKDKPVLVDPSQESAGDRAAFMRHVLSKVGTHRHFSVKEVEEGHDPHAKRGGKKAEADPPVAPHTPPAPPGKDAA